jgi:hypothetical protein
VIHTQRRKHRQIPTQSNDQLEESQRHTVTAERGPNRESNEVSLEPRRTRFRRRHTGFVSGRVTRIGIDALGTEDSPLLGLSARILSRSGAIPWSGPGAWCAAPSEDEGREKRCRLSSLQAAFIYAYRTYRLF